MRRRIYITFFLFITVLIGILSKIVSVTMDQNIQSVGLVQGSRTLVVSSVRGTIYDRNLDPIVNRNIGYFASFIPDSDTLTALHPALSTVSYQNLLAKAQNQVPLSIQLEKPVSPDEDIHTFRIPVRYSSYYPAAHLLGYLDGSGNNGLTGIEYAYNEVLSSHSGNVSVTYKVGGNGNAIKEADVSINDTINNSVGGVALTLDLDIQKLIDNVANEYLDKGSIIVLNAKNGDVLSMGSYPSFHPYNIGDALEQSDGSLMNRALSLYDCGSIFKIVTSIAALENDVPVERCYQCSGEITVNGTVFHCHNRDGHGTLNMTMAFAKSCNVYYIQLAQEIGAGALLSMAKQLGLCEEIHLADEIVSPSSVLPDLSDLNAPAALANFSFGQGKLLISPLQAARLTTVMTTNGTLLDVGAVLGLVKNNREIEYFNEREGETVISASTVKLMRRMMEAVVTDGTGISARSQYVSSAGKTGTAETGQISMNGSPVVQSWFTGYFPAEHPRYVVTVLAEDALNTANQATKVFCEISNKLMALS